MFNLWRDWFIDPKSGLPWSVVLFCPWLQMDSWFYLNDMYDTCDNENVDVGKNHVETKSTDSSAKTSNVVPTPKRKTSVSDKKETSPILSPVQTETASLAVESKDVVKPSKKVATKATTTKKDVVATVAKTEDTLPEKETSKKVKQVENTKSNQDIKPSQSSLSKVVSGKSTVNTIADKKSANVLNLDKNIDKKNNVASVGKLSVQAQNKITQISPASPKEQIREAILLLCGTQEWIDGATLASKLKHSLNQLETLHLVPMLRNGQLKPRYNDDSQPQEYCLA